MHQLVTRRLARFYWTSLATSSTPSSRVAAALVSRLALEGDDHGEDRTIEVKQRDPARLTAMSRSAVADGLAALTCDARKSVVSLHPDNTPLPEHPS